MGGGRGSSAVVTGSHRSKVGSLVALARMDSPRKGADHLNFAKSVTGALPCTLELLAAGELSEHRAAIIAKETRHLSQTDRREVDCELSSKLTGVGDRSVRDQARSTADRVDPDGAERRTRQARKASFAAVYAEPDGTARLIARMPFEKAIAVHRTLLAAVHDALKDKTETRLAGQIMADTLAACVLGDSTPTPHIEIQLVMNERTLLRGSDEPAYVAGYGPVPGFLARALIAETDKAWIRRLYTAPKTGELVAMDSTRRLFPPGLRRAVVARDRTCRTPYCNAEIKHIDHRRPWARHRKTAACNGDGLCERCNYVKTDAGLRVDMSYLRGRRVLELVTPTGHAYRSMPPDLPGTGPATFSEELRRALDDQRAMNDPDTNDPDTGRSA